MSDSLNLYLKYFHDGKNMHEILQQIEQENEKYEKGNVDNEHVDNMRKTYSPFISFSHYYRCVKTLT